MPNPTVTLAIRVSPELYARIQAAAKSNKLSINAQCVQILDKATK